MTDLPVRERILKIFWIIYNALISIPRQVKRQWQRLTNNESQDPVESGRGSPQKRRVKKTVKKKQGKKVQTTQQTTTPLWVDAWLKKQPNPTVEITFVLTEKLESLNCAASFLQRSHTRLVELPRAVETAPTTVNVEFRLKCQTPPDMTVTPEEWGRTFKNGKLGIGIWDAFDAELQRPFATSKAGDLCKVSNEVKSLDENNDLLRDLQQTFKFPWPSASIDGEMPELPEWLTDAQFPLEHFLQTMSQAAEIERHLHIGRHVVLEESIMATKRSIVADPSIEPLHIYNHGVAYLKNPNPSGAALVKALKLFACAVEAYKRKSSDIEEAIIGMEFCSFQCTIVIEEMLEIEDEFLQDVARNVGIDILVEIANCVEEIGIVNPLLKAEIRSRCLNYIGVCHGQFGDHHNEIKFYTRAVDVMLRKFGGECSEFAVFSNLINNLGAANDDLGNCLEAEKFYLYAVETYEYVKDWASQDWEMENLATVESNLRLVRTADCTPHHADFVFRNMPREVVEIGPHLSVQNLKKKMI